VHVSCYIDQMDYFSGGELMGNPGQKILSCAAPGNRRSEFPERYLNARPLCRKSGMEVWRFFLVKQGECYQVVAKWLIFIDFARGKIGFSHLQQRIQRGESDE